MKKIIIKTVILVVVMIVSAVIAFYYSMQVLNVFIMLGVEGVLGVLWTSKDIDNLKEKDYF
jgi:hypothetical protein